MTYIISLGGSLIVPDGIDLKFLKRFRQMLLARIKKGDKFYIIPGGGQTARKYMKAASSIAKSDNDSLDWIGIKTNHLHSHFLHAIFGKYAHPQIVELEDKSRIAKPIAICLGGLEPGGTSDSTALKFAEKFRIKTIINLTNVAGVYDRDPRKFENAKLIRRMTWTELKSQFGTGRTPGRNLPFDSAAANLAQRLGLKVVILNGKNLENFRSFITDKNFKGTVIQ